MRNRIQGGERAHATHSANTDPVDGFLFFFPRILPFVRDIYTIVLLAESFKEPFKDPSNDILFI